MKELYTLEECFEALGSKFPFEVDFYHNKEFGGYDIIRCTIIDKYKYETDGTYYYNFKTSNNSLDLIKYLEERGFYNDRDFDYKIVQYEKHFEDLLKE